MQDLLLSEYARGRRDFRRLDLSGTTLPPGADLSGADFRDANLSRVAWRGANLAGCQFCGATFGAIGLRRVVAALLAIVAGASFVGIAIIAVALCGAFSTVGVGLALLAFVFVFAFYFFSGRFGLARMVFGASGLATVGLAVVAVTLGLWVLRERWTAWREFWGVGEISFRFACGVLAIACLAGASLWAIASVQVLAVAVARWPTAICMAIASFATGAPALGSLLEATAAWVAALAIGSGLVTAAFVGLNLRLVKQAAAQDPRQRALRRLTVGLFALGAADFRRSDLTGADLSGADLRGVDLRGARLDGASWRSEARATRGLAWAKLDRDARNP